MRKMIIDYSIPVLIGVLSVIIGAKDYKIQLNQQRKKSAWHLEPIPKLFFCRL